MSSVEVVPFFVHLAVQVLVCRFHPFSKKLWYCGKMLQAKHGRAKASKNGTETILRKCCFALADAYIKT